MKIHHLGVVVSDVDEALLAFGLDRNAILETVYDPNQKNNLHIIHLPDNDMWIELVEPLTSDSSTANFAKKFGIGLHHLAMSSSDVMGIEKTYNERMGNFVLGRYGIRVDSFGGKIRTLFIAVKGLMLEFIAHER